MLCSIVHKIPFIYFQIIFVYLTIFLLNCFKVKAALPPGAEDEIVLIEHLPGRRVHLQDFFWTGAEDAPPWLDPDQTLTFYETRTVHHTATVYLPGEEPKKDGNSFGDSNDRSCPSCIEPTPALIDPDQDIGILIGDDPGPRYWLLTVLKAGESVPPKVELRLARLYRAAFARQQQRHLGLLSNDPRFRRTAKRRSTLDSHKSLTGDLNDNTYKSGFKRSTSSVALNNNNNNNNKTIAGDLLINYDDNDNNKTVRGKQMREVKILRDNNIILMLNESILKQSITLLNETTMSTKEYENISNLSMENYYSTKVFDNEKFNESSTSSSISSFSTISTSSTGLKNDYSTGNSTYRQVGNPQRLRSNPQQFYPDFSDDEYIKPTVDINSSSTITLNTKDNKNIFIKINQTIVQDNNNKTTLNNNTINSMNLDNNTTNSSTNSRLRNADIGIVQVRMQNTTTMDDGSTKLIYSVHLGGKPVPAETAAKDMALLSSQEVALELGAPVVIQSEPYLKETRPLALSRQRDAWLLIGAAGAAIALLSLIIVGIIITAKRKRAYSAVSAPPTQSILKKERRYSSTTPGLDNTGYTSETEGRTDGTSQRHTVGSLTQTPVTPNTPDTLGDDIQELSSDNEDIKKRIPSESWNIEEYPTSSITTAGGVSRSRGGRRKFTRTSAIEDPGSSDSIDTVIDCNERRESLENGCINSIEETASPHSYLSMPSCKLFPSVRTVEPLSRILEPTLVKHLDMEFETPEMPRRDNGFVHRKSDETFGRTRSAIKDPGVVGPIVWDLRRQSAVEEHLTSEADVEYQPSSSGPVGRARRRLHELLEDSFNLFSTKDVKTKENQVSTSMRPNSVVISPNRVTMFSESKEKSVHSSPIESPTIYSKTRPRTSLPRNGIEEDIPETGNVGPPPRGAWGSRPMSAGPFHRPNLPEVNVNVTRILTDSNLTPEDPAVPLIAAIRKELEKFTPERT